MFAWPREIFGVSMEGSLRRWNPISKRPYMVSGWTGRIHWYMFRKPLDGEQIVPDDFEAMLKEPNKNKDASYKGRVIERPEQGPSHMTYSVGADSQDERPFWDGEPVDWNALTTPSLENASWRAKVKTTLLGMINGVENFNNAHPGARPRTVDPLWKCFLRRINRIDEEIRNRGKVSEVKHYFWTPPAAIIDSDEEDSGEVAEHEEAVIDVSRFSVDSDMGADTDNIDASVVNEGGSDIGTSEPGDVVINVPESDGTIPEDLSFIHPPVDQVEDLVDQMDEVDLGIVIELISRIHDASFIFLYFYILHRSSSFSYVYFNIYRKIKFSGMQSILLNKQTMIMQTFCKRNRSAIQLVMIHHNRAILITQMTRL